MVKDVMAENEQISINQREVFLLKSSFPSYFNKQGDFDFEKCKEDLSKADVNFARESYELKFLGKSYAKWLTSLDTETVIVPDAEHNQNDINQNSENLYLIGDNLDAIKQLLKSYSGEIKFIYIDPPYNTGTDGFVYNDKFSFTAEQISGRAGVSVEEAEKIISMQGKSSSHAAWLTFMYPRLSLARNLLNDDGVIFISIDDNEVANLRLLCDDIFGEGNFEGHIHWRRRHNQPNDKTKMIGLVAEHIIAYSKDKEKFKESGVGKIDLTGSFSNPDEDTRGDWASKPWKVGSDQSGSRYTITIPSGKVLDEEWMGDEDTYKGLKEDNRIVFPRGGDGMPRKKYFRFEREEEGQCATNWWSHEEFGHNQGANNLMTELFGLKNVFSNPKPIELIRGLLQIANVKNDDTVLDFFSGSGTTAHSVMAYNAENDYKIKSISVQLPELLDPRNPEQKVACDFLSSINRPLFLSEIGIERIKRAAQKVKNDTNKDIDYGFKVYNLIAPDLNTLDKLEKFEPNTFISDEDILSEFGRDTVLTTWKILDRHGFNAGIDEINLNGYTAYKCNSTLYLINSGLDSSVVKDLVERYNNVDFFVNRIVLFGYSFTFNEIQQLKDNLKLLHERIKISIITRY